MNGTFLGFSILFTVGGGSVKYSICQIKIQYFVRLFRASLVIADMDLRGNVIVTIHENVDPCPPSFSRILCFKVEVTLICNVVIIHIMVEKKEKK